METTPIWTRGSNKTLISCGSIGNPQLINDILSRLADPAADVRFIACLALSAIPIEDATNAIVEVLMSGDEELRQAAAESLALDAQVGQKLLQEAYTVEDLLTRRAAVSGIMRIRDPWAKQALEKMAIENNQWVVRNAAAQAFVVDQPGRVHLTQPGTVWFSLAGSARL